MMMANSKISKRGLEVEIVEIDGGW